MHQLLPWLYRAVKVSLQSVWRIWSATMITDQRRQPPSSVPSPSSNCFSRAAVRVLQKQEERIGKTTEDVLQDWVRKRGSIITLKKTKLEGKPYHGGEAIRWRKRKQMKLETGSDFSSFWVFHWQHRLHKFAWCSDIFNTITSRQQVGCTVTELISLDLSEDLSFWGLRPDADVGRLLSQWAIFSLLCHEAKPFHFTLWLDEKNKVLCTDVHGLL